MAAFTHFDLALLKPAFDTPLLDVLIDLDHLRRLKLSGTTPAPLFFQLKSVFHKLESLGSARIEGNHTTLADYVESSLDGSATASEHLAEIANIEEAMVYVETFMEPGAEVS
jgi:Fic family protein